MGDRHHRPVKVAELRLEHEITPLLCAGYDRVIALVRWRERVLGWLHFEDVTGGAVPATMVRERLLDRLAVPLATAILGAPLRADEGNLPQPPISVVVCTRDRSALLAQCLTRLFAVDYPAFEVVVVDNASTSDASARVVARFPAIYVREDRAGLDWARNRGLATARYDLIAFLDDDAQADGDWLRALAHAFADPAVGAVTGFVAPAELETRAQILFEWGYGGMGKGLIPHLFYGFAMTADELIAAHDVGVGTNMAYRRGVLETLGAFDTALDVGTPARGGGDLDMLHRVLVAGHTVRYDPAAIVWHRHRREYAELRHQLESDGRAFGVYLLTRWRRRSVPRRALLSFAVLRWGRWLVGRLLRGLVGRSELPLPLLWAPLQGLVRAPGAYRQTHRRDRRLRAGVAI